MLSRRSMVPPSVSVIVSLPTGISHFIFTNFSSPKMVKGVRRRSISSSCRIYLMMTSRLMICKPLRDGKGRAVSLIWNSASLMASSTARWISTSVLSRYSISSVTMMRLFSMSFLYRSCAARWKMFPKMRLSITSSSSFRGSMMPLTYL